MCVHALDLKPIIALRRLGNSGSLPRLFFHIYDVIEIPTRPGILSTETVFTLVLNNMQ